MEYWENIWYVIEKHIVIPSNLTSRYKINFQEEKLLVFTKFNIAWNDQVLITFIEKFLDLTIETRRYLGDWT